MVEPTAGRTQQQQDEYLAAIAHGRQMEESAAASAEAAKAGTAQMAAIEAGTYVPPPAQLPPVTVTSASGVQVQITGAEATALQSLQKKSPDEYISQLELMGIVPEGSKYVSGAGDEIRYVTGAAQKEAQEASKAAFEVRQAYSTVAQIPGVVEKGPTGPSINIGTALKSGRLNIDTSLLALGISAAKISEAQTQIRQDATLSRFTDSEGMISPQGVRDAAVAGLSASYLLSRFEDKGFVKDALASKDLAPSKPVSLGGLAEFGAPVVPLGISTERVTQQKTVAGLYTPPVGPVSNPLIRAMSAKVFPTVFNVGYGGEKLSILEALSNPTFQLFTLGVAGTDIAPAIRVAKGAVSGLADLVRAPAMGRAIVPEVAMGMERAGTAAGVRLAEPTGAAIKYSGLTAAELKAMGPKVAEAVGPRVYSVTRTGVTQAEWEKGVLQALQGVGKGGGESWKPSFSGVFRPSAIVQPASTVPGGTSFMARLSSIVPGMQGVPGVMQTVVQAIPKAAYMVAPAAVVAVPAAAAMQIPASALAMTLPAAVAGLSRLTPLQQEVANTKSTLDQALQQETITQSQYTQIMQGVQTVEQANVPVTQYQQVVQNTLQEVLNPVQVVAVKQIQSEVATPVQGPIQTPIKAPVQTPIQAPIQIPALIPTNIPTTIPVTIPSETPIPIKTTGIIPPVIPIIFPKGGGGGGGGVSVGRIAPRGILRGGFWTRPGLIVTIQNPWDITKPYRTQIAKKTSTRYGARGNLGVRGLVL